MVTVVSGGQTGVDRAALDAAVKTGVPYRGWVPKGGWAEDMPEPPGLLVRYPLLKETPSYAPEQRTDWNVRDADGLLVLVDRTGLTVSTGTERAVAHAHALGKPCLILDVEDKRALDQARNFLRAHELSAVCIAGPRESEAPGLYGRARAALLQLLGALSDEDK